MFCVIKLGRYVMVTISFLLFKFENVKQKKSLFYHSYLIGILIIFDVTDVFATVDVGSKHITFHWLNVRIKIKKL